MSEMDLTSAMSMHVATNPRPALSAPGAAPDQEQIDTAIDLLLTAMRWVDPQSPDLAVAEKLLRGEDVCTRDILTVTLRRRRARQRLGIFFHHDWLATRSNAAGKLATAAGEAGGANPPASLPPARSPAGAAHAPHRSSASAPASRSTSASLPGYKTGLGLLALALTGLASARLLKGGRA